MICLLDSINESIIGSKQMKVSLTLVILGLLMPALCWATPCEPGWSTGTAAPDGFHSGKAAYYKDKIYVTSGMLTAPMGQFIYLNELWIYDIFDDSWTIGPVYDETGWAHSCMVADQNRIMLFGGYRAYFDYFKTTKIYDADQDEWTDGADMPSLTYGAYCALIDKTVHVASGEIGVPYSHFAYDIVNDSWKADIAQLPDNLYFGLGASDGELFYVISGKTQWENSEKIYAYDPESDTWNELADIRPWRFLPGGGFAGDGLLYVFSGGGLNDESWDAYDTHTVYHTVDNTWEDVALPIPTPVAGPASVYVPEYGGMFYLFGGGDGTVVYDTTQIYSLCLATIEQIQPDSGKNDVDVAVTISGWGFAEDDGAYLSNDDLGFVELNDIVIQDSQTITAVVPKGSPAGIYELVVDSESGERDTLSQAFEIIETGGGDDDDDDDDSGGICGGLASYQGSLDFVRRYALPVIQKL